ncbi:hypothetical protein LTR81_027258 [Elasticomyces elasticus]
MVPGTLPRLHVPHLPLNLLPDMVAFKDDSTDGKYTQVYRFRFEPLVLACTVNDPSFAVTDADIVSGVNNLRLLMDFAFETSNKSFRIDLEFRAQTLFMTRWESELSNLARTSRCRGYGRGFEEVSTVSKGVDPQQTSHHQVVSYNLGGLKTIVQYQADACNCQCGETWSDDAIDKAAKSPDVMSTVSDDCLRVIKGGISHTSSCLVEIKSRESRNHDLHDILPQLWLSRQSIMMLGRHSGGHFTTIESHDMDHQIGVWEECHGHLLESYTTLLAEIYRTVRAAADRTHECRFALLFCRDQNAGTLQLFDRRDGQEMLAPDCPIAQ